MVLILLMMAIRSSSQFADEQWISAPICVKYAWLSSCSGSYSVHTGMYFEVSYIRVHTSTYRYVPVQTRYTPKTMFLYNWSRFQMFFSWICWPHLDSCQHTISYVGHTISYNGDMAYDIVCFWKTISYVKTYDIVLVLRHCILGHTISYALTYDVATYDII